MLPLNTNARAKMSGLRRGFVKIFCRPATGVVIGGVVVAPDRLGADPADRPGGAELAVGERSGADAFGVPVARRVRSSRRPGG